MQALLIYLLKVFLISGLLLLYYIIALHNNRFHYYNRFYLLLTVLLSTVLPLLHLQWFTFTNSSKAVHVLNIIYASDGENFVVTTGNSFYWQPFILPFIISVSSIFFIIALSRVLKIYRLKKKFPVNKISGFDFILTDLQSAPFSFLKNIFWRNDINLNDETGKQILQHEITHIQQKHSWDKLFMQFVLCFYWVNPFFWWLQKELNLVHEFIADEKAVENYDAASFAKMLLTAQYGKFEFFPAQSIFYSPIKRRLIMLTTSKKPHLSYLRRIMVLPLLACVVCLFAFKLNEQKTTKNVTPVAAKTNFKLVVDAGHGGKDFGSEGNGLYEKDVALKIAEEIKKLSPQYGIDVVLTRDNDVFMSPPQKVDFANAQNAGAFISIHVNSAPNSASNSGMEVLLSKRNTNILDNSKVLGSAIIQNLEPDFSITHALLQRNVGVWVLDQSNTPSVLIECGYMTNASDINLLKQNDKIELMARNILQGVAMYANNKVDKSSLYQVENKDDDTSVPSSSIQNTVPPLYFVNGKETSAEKVKAIPPENINSINVLKGHDAIAKFGSKGKNGVVEITLKDNKDVIAPEPPLPPVEPKSTPVAPEINDTEPVFTTAQFEPKFPGGVKGWEDYLMKNLDANVPAKKNAPAGTYTVTVSFLVDQNGKVSQAKALTDPGFGTAEEAVRVIAQGPNWIPAVQNGHKVVCVTKQNITFQITKD